MRPLNNPAKADFQNDINGLRGISVLLVVLYHFNIKMVSGGFVGVDIFFVISGFLMTKIIVTRLLADRFSYMGFIVQRALRIIPAMFVLIAALLLLGVFLLPPTDLYSLAEQSLQAVIFNANNYFAARQGYFNAGADDRWLLHTWSLAVEWQFYILYPLLLGLLFKISGLAATHRRKEWFSGLLWLVFFTSLAYCLSRDSQSAFFSVMARSWQMIAGGLVYLAISRRNGAARFHRSVCYTGIAVILFSVFMVKYFALEALWPGYFALAPVVGACLVLFAGAPDNFVLNNRVMQGVGRWSYSIYLWHWPVVIALTITGLLTLEPKLFKIIGILLSLLLGYLSYRYVETPPSIKQFLQRATLFKIPSFALVLLFASYALVSTDGYISRASDQGLIKKLAIAEASDTYDPACENTGLQNDRFCHINRGVPGKRLLVIGDSHAGHLYPWFVKNSRIDTTFYVKSGCPLIAGFERVGANKACRDYSQRAFAMAESGMYQEVLISQNWTWFSKDASGICSFENNRCIPPIQSATPSLALDRTRESLLSILQKQISVVVVDGTPTFQVNAPRKIERDLFWSGKVENEFDSKWFFDENSEYDQLFEKLKVHPNFRLVSLRPDLCQGKSCSIFDTKMNAPIYKDDSHFNPEWLLKNGNVFSFLAH